MFEALKKGDSIRNENIPVFILATLSFILSYHKFLFLEYFYAYIDIGADTVSNYWPQYVNISNHFKSNDFSFYTFQMGIGTSLFSNASFLTDPFNLLLYMGNTAQIPEKFIYIVYLKILFSSFTAYHLLRLFNLDKWICWIGSLLLAYAGWAIIWGQHYNFHTSYFFSLLLLYGIEQKLRYPKKFIALFIATVGLVISGLYFSYMTLFFATFYYLSRLTFLRLPILYTTVRFLKIGILAALVSACAVLPALVEILQSPRISGKTTKDMFQLVNPEIILQTFLRMLSPNIKGVGSFSHSVLNYYEDPNLYFTSLGFILAYIGFAHVFKSKLRLFLLLLLTYSICFTFISSFMNGFSAMYFRWHYLLVIVLVILCAKALKGLFDRTYIASTFDKIFILLFPALLTFFSYFIWKPIFFDMVRSYHFFIPLFFYYSFYFALFHLENNQKKKALLVGLCFFEITFVTFCSVSLRNAIPTSMKLDNGQPDLYPELHEAIRHVMNLDPEKYRIHFLDWKSLNEPLHYNYLGLITYSSLNDSGYLRYLMFSQPENLDSMNLIKGPGSNLDLLKALGVRYLGAVSELSSDDLHFVYKTKQHHVYRIKDSEHPFLKFRQTTLPKICYKQSTCNEPNTLKRFAYTDEELPLGRCNQVACSLDTSDYQISEFDFGDGTIKFLLTGSGATTGILGFPYHKGFTLKIDGENSPTTKVDGGLIGFNPVPGKHSYSVTYEQPYLKTGLYLSILGIFLLLLDLVFRHKLRTPTQSYRRLP